MKPFLDSYHAPYKTKHRYWPGLLLVLCFVLLLVFGFNPQQDTNINLLAILMGAGILQLCMGLGQWWGLQELVFRRPGSRFIFTKPDHASWYNLLCQVFRRKSACSGLHFLHCTCDIHCNPYLPHLPASEAHQAVGEKMPKLNLKKLNKKLNTKQIWTILSLDDVTESVNLDQLCEPWLEDLLEPTNNYNVV